VAFCFCDISRVPFSLVDFNDLFVIAIGLSAAYMWINEEQGGSNEKGTVGKFYAILSKLISSIRKWALNLHSKSLREITKIKQTAEYYNANTSLSEKARGAIMLVKRHVDRLEKGLDCIKVWNENSLNKWGRANYLRILTFDCFWFGIIMLFIGAFENKHGFNTAPLLHWLLYAMLFASIHNIVFESINTNKMPIVLKWMKPGVVLHFIIILAGLVIGLLATETPWPNWEMNVLVVIAVIVSFGGFLMYLGMILVAGIIISAITLLWTFFMRIKITFVRKWVINKDLDDIEELSKSSKNADLVEITLTNETTGTSIVNDSEEHI